jgi:2'-5' RNA ligase
MPRLFTGIELPQDIREGLAALRQPLPSARWQQPENLHITLRFAGDITPSVAREFAMNLGNIAFDPFPVRLVGLGTFGGDNPRLIYAAVEPSEPLLALARANETAARRAGLKPEGRKFSPHITLARLQAPRIDPIARYLGRHARFTTEPFLVSQFALFSSKPNTGGGPYVIEQQFSSTMGNWEEHDWHDEFADHGNARDET